MIKLDSSEYFIADKIFSSIPFNYLFALSVVSGNDDGEIYVDEKKRPTVYLIVSKYGIGLLYSSSTTISKRALINSIKMLTAHKTLKWIMVHPEEFWRPLLLSYPTKTLVKPKAELILDKRINFVFRKDAFKPVIELPSFIKILPYDHKRDGAFPGNVVPKNFWRADKIHKCQGYSLFYKDKIAAVSFSSYKVNNLFEIGVETNPKYRGKGLAYLVSSKIINYCVSNKLVPLWACHHKNEGSIALANRLGFMIDSYHDYYTFNREQD